MTSRLPSNLTYFQETTNSNRDITETYSISQVFHVLLIATPNKLSRLQGQTHRDELGDLVLLINKKQWEVNWKLASGHKKKEKKKVEPWVILQQWSTVICEETEGRNETKARDTTWTGAREFFCVLRACLWRLRSGLQVWPRAPALSMGITKQAKCVTCPNAVAESLRGHRAQARRLLFIHCAAPRTSTDSFHSFSS